MCAPLVTAILMFFCVGTAWGEPALTEQRPIRGSITATAFFASFDGSLQTPLGGADGSTSRNRPTTNEIGLSGVEVHALVDVELQLFERHALHGSYAHLIQDGSDRLEKRLVSQGQTVPKGARVRSRLEVPFARLGYRALWLPLSIRSWSIVPEVGAARLDFRYRLRSREASGPIDRDYVVYFAYWGLHGEGSLLPRLRGEADLFASAGLSNVISIDSDFRLVYEVLTNEAVAASLVLGVRGIWLRYKDDQREEQNEINVRSGAFSTRPWAGAHLGLRLNF